MAKTPKPCLAIWLIPGADPRYASSYHWCQMKEHSGIHLCYCGLAWQADPDDLVEPTAEMVKWRTGSEVDLKQVSGRMLG